MSTSTSATPSRGIIALVGAILAAVLVPLSFVYGITAALDGSGSGSLLFQILFIVGLALALAAIVVSVVRMVRGAPKLVPVLTIVIALLPFIGVLIVLIATLNAS